MNKIVTFSILLLSLNLFAYTNDGSINVPYRGNQIVVLEDKFSHEASPLNSSNLNYLEKLFLNESKLFFVESSYQTSSSLNVLVLESFDISYSATLVSIDYSEIQNELCDLEEPKDSYCYSRTPNITSLMAVNSAKGLYLTELGKKVVSSKLHTSSTFPAVFKAYDITGKPDSGFFIYITTEKTTPSIDGTNSIIKTRKVELRVHENGYLITKGDLLFCSKSNNMYNNTQIGIFPIQNKLLVGGIK